MNVAGREEGGGQSSSIVKYYHDCQVDKLVHVGMNVCASGSHYLCADVRLCVWVGYDVIE